MNASITSNYIYNIYLKFKMKKLLLVVFRCVRAVPVFNVGSQVKVWMLYI